MRHLQHTFTGLRQLVYCSLPTQSSGNTCLQERYSQQLYYRTNPNARHRQVDKLGWPMPWRVPHQ